MWSRKHEKCIGCGTIDIPHWSRGYCNKCYPKYIIRKTGGFDKNNKEFYSNFMEGVKRKISETQKIRRGDAVKIRERLNANLLEDLYRNKKMSFGDIAKQFKCSRNYIYILLQRYGIKVKTKPEARSDAFGAGKNIRFSPVNTNFFNKWSSEMAYVLGFIYADGCIGRRLNYFSISQKETEILEKIKKILQAEHNIDYYPEHQDLHHLVIGNKKMVDRLLKLGVTPSKSLVIKFPEVPNEYKNDFIRGYFDGDGSIFLNSGRWVVSFLSGSEKFIQQIKENMETMVGLISKATIHKHGSANAFYIRYFREDDLRKIFNFFYDDYTLKNQLFLTRKYERFKEAVGISNTITKITKNS